MPKKQNIFFSITLHLRIRTKTIELRKQDSFEQTNASEDPAQLLKMENDKKGELTDRQTVRIMGSFFRRQG